MLYNDIYSYLRQSIGIKNLTYHFSKDYINERINRGEQPCYDDLQFLYNECNMSRLELSSLFNVSEALIKKWLKNYGITKSYEQRIKNTNKTLLKRYGVHHNSQTLQYKEHYSNTCMKKYGVKYYSQTNDCKEKTKKTLREKYGSFKYVNLDKQKETLMTKYGVEHSAYLCWSKKTCEIMLDREQLRKYIVENGIETEIELSRLLNVSKTTISQYIRKYALRGLIKGSNTSLGENEVKAYVKSFVSIVANDREIIAPYELDIYIPSLKKAIEYNGNYWHNYDLFPEKRDRDELKKKLCENKGIKLLTIWESDWTQNREEMEKIIKKYLDNDDKL